MRRAVPVTLALVLLLPASASAVPDLVHRGFTVLDLQVLGADNDRSAEPGETFDLALRLGNEGSAARTVRATLRSLDARLTVAASPASVAFPDIAPGAMATATAPHFRLTAAMSLACGTPIPLELTVTFTDPAGPPGSAILPFLLLVGEETLLAREDFDTGPGGWAQDDPASTPAEPPNRNGRWVNAAPQSYLWGGLTAQPGRDVSWPDVSALYTGQNIFPATPSLENVDGGNQVLSSRTYDLSGRSNVYLTYWRWFFTDDTTGGDSWELLASGDGGAAWVSLERITASQGAWTPVARRLDDFIPLTAAVELRVVVTDGGLDTVCEAAIDELALASYACAPNPPGARLDSAFAGLLDDLDPACTDSDGIADAGETVQIDVAVENQGTSSALSAFARLVSIPPELVPQGPTTVSLGTLADNGGRATASFTLLVDGTTACQTPAILQVEVGATAPSTGTTRSYPLTLEEDRNQPTVRWYDDFDSGLPAWTVVLFGVNSDWIPTMEDCAQNPGPVPARRIWYTGTNLDPGDCQVTPYGPNNDSAIRSPVIDTGYTTPQLFDLSWSQLLTMGPGELAEVRIDHDLDGVFTPVGTFQGQVTTNGDTLDPATLDVRALTGATRMVQLEFRFVSDGTGGGGSPLALGWMVDTVELTWTDGDGRGCDANTCSGCAASAVIAPAPVASCTGVPVTLDASGSALVNCTGGVRLYAWTRDGLPVVGATAMYTANEPSAGVHTYGVTVTCSTISACSDTASHTIAFAPNGTPVAVGNTLRAWKAGADVELVWTDAQPFAATWDIGRATVAGGTPVWTNGLVQPSYTDVGAIGPGPGARLYYGVRAVSCSGTPGP